MSKLIYPELSYIIRGIAFDIYKKLGSGHKERVYCQAFCQSLRAQNIVFDVEKRIKVYFRGERVGTYTPDIVVGDTILVELKAKKSLTKQDLEQFWQYLRSSSYKLGFLINFGSPGEVTIVRRVYETARKK
jgi:GxxExxY protein